MKHTAPASIPARQGKFRSSRKRKSIPSASCASLVALRAFSTCQGVPGLQLDAEDPGPPGTLKMHGELPTMHMKLMGWIFVSDLIGICLAVLGLRLVPYVSFTLATPAGVRKVIVLPT